MEPAILSPATAVRAARSRPPLLGWIAAGALLVGSGILAILHFRQMPPTAHELRATIAAPEGASNIHSIAISPDGRYLAIAAQVNGKRHLWMRTLDALQAQAMPGTDDAGTPSGLPTAAISVFSGRESSRRSPAAADWRNRCATRRLAPADRGTAKT